MGQLAITAIRGLLPAGGVGRTHAHPLCCAPTPRPLRALRAAHAPYLPLPHPVQQNVGNFITDRCSSRVLAPPGGVTSIVFGDASSASEPAPSPRRRNEAPLSPAARAGLPAGLPPPGALSVGADAKADNNYARAEGAPAGLVLGVQARGDAHRLGWSHVAAWLHTPL